MRRVLLLAVGLMCMMYSPVIGQNIPVTTAPNESIEPTEVIFEIFHQTGNSFYDIQVDTTTEFNSIYKREIIGTTDHISTPQGPFVEDTLDNLYFGKTYYWRSRSRDASTTSEWSTPKSFTTIDKPVIIAPTDMSTHDPTNLQVFMNYQGGTKDYIIEVSLSPGFTYPIYYRNSSGVLLVNPNITHGTQFTTLLNGMPNSGDVYIRTIMKNDLDSSRWSDTVQVHLEEPNSITTDDIIDNSVTVFPNPTNGIVRISDVSEDMQQIQVLDFNGRVVIDQSVNGEIQIDLSTLPSGLYTIKLISNTSSVVKKIRVVK